MSYLTNTTEITGTLNLNPEFEWQVGYQDGEQINENLQFRVTVRPLHGLESYTRIPNSGYVYEETGIFLNTVDRLGKWEFPIQSNIDSNGGPYRDYQVVVEAHDSLGNTSAGNRVNSQDENGWAAHSFGYDITAIHNPRPSGIELSSSVPTEYYYGSGYSAYYIVSGITGYHLQSGQNYIFYGRPTGNYISNQYVGPNGDVGIEFTSGIFNEDIVGGYFYISTGRFPKYNAAVNTGYWGESVNKVKFDFDPNFPKIVLPNAAQPFIGSYLNYCSVSFYDELDSALIDRGINISTGLYISDNAEIYCYGAVPRISMGGTTEVYAVKIVGEASSATDPLITNVIGIEPQIKVLNFTTNNGYTAVLYMGPPLNTPYSGIAGTGAGCLSSGTFVTNKYYQNLPIYKYNVGDEILCFDTVNSSLTTGYIHRIIKNSYHSYYRINGSLEITYEHPVYIERNNSSFYCKTKDLITGDLMINYSGHKEEIKSIDFVNTGLSTWNFQVLPYCNFFANNVLVHNSPPLKG